MRAVAVQQLQDQLDNWVRGIPYVYATSVSHVWMLSVLKQLGFDIEPACRELDRDMLGKLTSSDNRRVMDMAARYENMVYVSLSQRDVAQSVQGLIASFNQVLEAEGCKLIDAMAVQYLNMRFSMALGCEPRSGLEVKLFGGQVLDLCPGITAWALHDVHFRNPTSCRTGSGPKAHPMAEQLMRIFEELHPTERPEALEYRAMQEFRNSGNRASDLIRQVYPDEQVMRRVRDLT